MALNHQKAAWIGTGVVFLSFLATLIVVYLSTREFVETASRAARNHELRVILEHVNMLVEDIDSSHRAYLVSGLVEVLEPYNAARGVIGPKLQQAVELTRDQPQYRERLTTLNRLVADQLTVAVETIRLGEEDMTAARAFMASDPAPGTVDAIRSLIKELIVDTAGVVVEHGRRNQAVAESTLAYVGGVALLCVTFMFGGVLVYAYESSTRQRTLAALADTQTKQDVILNALPIVTYSAKPSGSFGALWVSSNIQAVSGFPSTQFLEDPDFRMSRLHHDDRDRVLEAFACLSETRKLSIEYRWQMADGTYRWFLDHAVLTTHSKSGQTELVGMWLDTTSQRATEEELRQVNEQVTALVRASPIGIVILDADGRCLLWNPAAEHIFGWRADEVIGHPLPTVGPTQSEEHRLLRERVLAGDAFSDMEIVRRRKDGSEIDISLSTAPLRDRDGLVCGLIGLMSDISGRKRTATELRQAYEQLRALSQRLDSVREEESARIAREIHDELGQALTAAKLDLAWVITRLEKSDDPMIRTRIRERLLALTHSTEATIQAVRKIATALRPRILDELGLVAAIEWLGHDFETRTGVRCHCSLPPHTISLDPGQATALFRICQEALTNVMRHAHATHVHLCVARTDHEVTLEVTDDGHGIPDQALASSRSLGLLGMRERAQQWGGTLSIRRTSEKGTTLTVKMPEHGGAHGQNSGC